MIYRILTIVLIIAATIGYSLYQNSSLQSNLVPDSKSETVLAKLPSAKFETLDGKVFSLDELYLNQKPTLVMVHYWGTWCAPCEVELPELVQLMKKYENQTNVVFLLVAVNDESVKVMKHLKEKGVDLKGSVHWLIDNKNVYKEQFGTNRVPETYVFSSDKTTLRKFTGPQNWSKASYFQTFDELLLMSSQKL